MTIQSKIWKNGFVIVWYYSDDDGLPMIEKAATHVSLIYECETARLDDPRNASRSYMIIPR